MMRFHTTVLAAALLLCAYTAVAASSALSEPADLGPYGPGATGAPSASGEQPIGPSVSEYLGPDGQIDLEAIRASGYQGALDLKGFEVRTDEQLGLVVEPSVERAPSSNPDDIYWSEGFGPQGMDNDVYALTVYGSSLIAGGDFTTAGAGGANYIAAWDGSSWAALGSGMNSGVHALTVYANRLIAGGAFWIVSGVAANYIAAWDGSSWAALGSGMNSWVYALTVYANSLIAGGNFTTAGDKSSRYVAQWTKGTAGVPAEPTLGHNNFQSFPNPFRDITRLAFGVDHEETVALAIYDVRGRLVRTLVNRRAGAGAYSQEWDGSNDRGAMVPSGIYFWRL